MPFKKNHKLSCLKDGKPRTLHRGWNQEFIAGILCEHGGLKECSKKAARGELPEQAEKFLIKAIPSNMEISGDRSIVINLKKFKPDAD
jgi:hypothetical protein